MVELTASQKTSTYHEQVMLGECFNLFYAIGLTYIVGKGDFSREKVLKDVEM